MPVFTENEYKGRVKKTKKAMEERGIDLLVVVQPANMNYLTGYDGWSFYVHQCVLVSLDQEEPVWIGRGMDANGARLTTHLSEENIREYADHYVHSTIRHPMDYVSDVIKEKGWDKKRIGVESDQFYFTHKSFTTLEKNLPDARFVDADVLVNWVRVVKSEREIEFLKRAGQIAVKVMDAAIGNIDVGVRECDVSAEIAKAQYAGTDEFAGDYPSIVPLMMSGEATKAPHLTWSEKRYEKNMAVLLELGAAYRHYQSPIARTIYLGKEPPALMRDTANVVIDGLKKTLDFVKPGVTAEQVEEKWRQAISHSTVVKESRLGYSVGVNYPPDWGEQTISLRPGDKTELQPNMALHLIPGIWYEDVGFEIDATIRVTEKGCEGLYDYPFEMFLK
ncbi:MAG: M24 family metallopeptidase [Spirochaetia bacterium]